MNLNRSSFLFIAIFCMPSIHCERASFYNQYLELAFCCFNLGELKELTALLKWHQALRLDESKDHVCNSFPQVLTTRCWPLCSTTSEVSGRKYNGRYRENTVPFETYRATSWDSLHEIQDTNRAITLSLTEAGKGKYMKNDSPLKDDEHLARALQESLKLEPPQWNRNLNRKGHVYQPIPFPNSASFRRCVGCNRGIDRGQLLNRLGAVWHPECFRCRACNLPITDYEFSLSRNYAYHKSCYKENNHPQCDVCQHFIRSNTAGFIEYKVHPFWAQKYCPIHERDGTPKCCSCERMEPRETQYISLNDGRKLCLECLDSAVMDTTECQPLYHDIQKFYENLNMKVEQKIPLLLVERQALNEAMDVEKNGHYHMPETRGLCLSEEQTVSTVIRNPRIGIGNMRTQPYKLTRRSEVTAILILCGLPRLLTGSILAHEMMHAWLRLSGYQTLRQDVEEGICQVLGYMWLTSQISTISNRGKGYSLEKKLADFFKQQIESDQSHVYGNGFRNANRAVLKYGLQKTLYHIRSTGNFPY